MSVDGTLLTHSAQCNVSSVLPNKEHHLIHANATTAGSGAADGQILSAGGVSISSACHASIPWNQAKQLFPVNYRTGA
jgi:hypothetical protein